MEWFATLILGCLLLWLSTKVGKRAVSSIQSNAGFLQPHIEEIRDLRRALQESQKAIKLLEKSFKQNRELDVIVVLEAEQRENRAKAALVAVLQQNGCSEEQISGVLSKIDRPEDS